MVRARASACRTLGVSAACVAAAARAQKPLAARTQAQEARLRRAYFEDEELTSRHVQDLAWEQIEKFRRDGVNPWLLDALFDVDGVQNHGLLRVRIIDGDVFVRKKQAMKTGHSTAFDDWNERQLHWLEGLLSTVENEFVVDVDFVVGLSDLPYCELYPWAEAMPVFVFAQTQACGNILVPDNSLMHEEYRDATHGSPFSWLRAASEGLRWEERDPGILWDGDFQKASRARLSALRRYLSVRPPRPLARFDENGSARAHHACGHKLSLDAEGFSYSMRLKNVLLCSSAAMLYRPRPEERYEEYWTSALIEGVHYYPIRSWDTDLAEGDILRVLATPDGELRLLALRGFLLAVNLLRPQMVSRYLAKLLYFYSMLQDFDVRRNHEADSRGFELVTRRHLADVRAHARSLKVHVFNFYYPSQADVLSQLPLDPAAIDIHHVPCWGNAHRMVQCCSAFFSFYRKSIGDYDPDATVGTSSVHPFCSQKDMDPGQVHRVCCDRTLVHIVPLFRNSLDVYNRFEVLALLDRGVQALPVQLEHTVQLLAMARGLALRRALRAPFAAVDGERGPSQAMLAGAWLAEETLQLTTAIHEIARGETPGPHRMQAFKMLQRERHRARRAERELVVPLAAAAASGSLELLLVLGDSPSTAPLASLLANRGCPLVLHLLGPRNVSTAWVDDLVAQRGKSDVTVHRHTPLHASVAVCEHVPNCPVLGTPMVESECDLRFAALVAEFWLSHLDWIAVVDLSDDEAGPLFLGDVCELPQVAAAAAGAAAAGRASGAVVYAAKHLEHARWDVELWSPAVMAMDLARKRRYTFGELLRHVPAACAIAGDAGGGWYRGALPRRFSQLWLGSLAASAAELLATLPSPWGFVPYEPWLFDVSWSGLMSVPSLAYKWRELFRVREYPGFDGQVLRVACPPAAAHAPVAMFTMTGVLAPSSSVAGRIPDDWGFWSGPCLCGERVRVLSLRWERGDEEPRYPFRLREAAWVRELVARYEEAG